MLDVAEHYVRVRTGAVKDWTSDGGSTLGTWAGDRALRLLMAHRPECLPAMPKEMWDAWGPVIARNRPSGDDKSISLHRALLTRAYGSAPERMAATVRDVLMAEDRTYGMLLSLDSLDPLWDELIAAQLLDLARQPELSSNSLRAIAELLLERDSPGVYAYCVSLFSPRLPSRGATRERAVAAAAALLSSAPDGGWAPVSHVIRRAPKFRRELALAVGRSIALDRFSEAQLAGVFLWLTEDFPYPDPWYEGVYSPSAEDEARQLRGDVIRTLRERATPAAVVALQDLKERFPDLEWLSNTILATRAAVRRETWTPADVTQLIEMSQASDCRLVESGDQLLRVLMDSLTRFEGELHGELPAVVGLWDQTEPGRYRPKGEEELSDAISRHFRRDLRDRAVVAGREVVIRRGGASGIPGQRTDIYVTALSVKSDQRRGPIAAIVEVKGSWHDDVLTAMKTQLVDDYLADNPECNVGLYIVGWFLCDRWQDEGRKAKTERHGSRHNLIEILDAQAAGLSDQERRVRALVVDTSWP